MVKVGKEIGLVAVGNEGKDGIWFGLVWYCQVCRCMSMRCKCL